MTYFSKSSVFKISYIRSDRFQSELFPEVTNFITERFQMAQFRRHSLRSDVFSELIYFWIYSFPKCLMTYFLRESIWSLPIFRSARFRSDLFFKVTNFRSDPFSKWSTSNCSVLEKTHFWSTHFDKWSNSKWPIFRSDRLQSVWKIVSQKLISKWPL